MEPWWTVQQTGLIGGIGGAAIGMVGALVGSLSFLIVRGKGKPFMVGLFGVMIAVGVALLGVTIVAMVKSQPRHVWYPLMLGGILSTVLFGSLLPVVLIRYRAAETRRMEAEQLRRS